METLKLAGCIIAVVLGFGLMVGLSAVAATASFIIGIIVVVAALIYVLALGLRDYFRNRKSKS